MSEHTRQFVEPRKFDYRIGLLDEVYHDSWVRELLSILKPEVSMN